MSPIWPTDVRIDRLKIKKTPLRPPVSSAHPIALQVQEITDAAMEIILCAKYRGVGREGRPRPTCPRLERPAPQSQDWNRLDKIVIAKIWARFKEVFVPLQERRHIENSDREHLAAF